MTFKRLCLSLLIMTATAILSAVSCMDDWYLHPEHLVYGYTDSPWYLGTKADFVAKDATIDDFIYYSQSISGFDKVDQSIWFYLTNMGYAFTSGEHIYETLCEKHGDRKNPPVSWSAIRQASFGHYFSTIDFTALEVSSTEDFDAAHPTGSSLLDILHFATTSPSRILRNDYQLYFDTDVLKSEDGKQVFNICKRGVDVKPEDLSILNFIFLTFDKLPDPVEPKHILVRLTADDGKTYGFETLLTFQEIDYHSSIY